MGGGARAPIGGVSGRSIAVFLARSWALSGARFNRTCIARQPLRSNGSQPPTGWPRRSAVGFEDAGAGIEVAKTRCIQPSLDSSTPRSRGRIGPSGRPGCRSLPLLAALCRLSRLTTRYSLPLFRFANVRVAGPNPVSCSIKRWPSCVPGHSGRQALQLPRAESPGHCKLVPHSITHLPMLSR